MTKPWHDINIPRHLSSQNKDSCDSKGIFTGVDEEYLPERKPTSVEYRIKFVRPVEPSSGYMINKPFCIEGEIDQLVKPITLPRIKIYPTGIYKGEEDCFFPSGIDAFPDENGRFKVTCDHLFMPSEYHNDKEKHENATWELVIRATGISAEKECRSEPVSFPRPSKAFIVLRKGHYDDNGAQTHQLSASGEDYLSGNDVKMLQQDLIFLKILSEGDDDGFFGEKTETAIKEFQKYAIDKYRLPLKSGLLIETPSVLQKSTPDGIVDTLTCDELDLWRKNGWIKPVPTLRRGDYDDAGVRNRLGKRSGEDHHAGTVVYDLQKSLRELGFETEENGYFGEKTEEALIDFQNFSQQVTRDLDGKEVAVEITFSGKANGIFDEPTRAELELWKENRYRAPAISDDAQVANQSAQKEQHFSEGMSEETKKEIVNYVKYIWKNYKYDQSVRHDCSGFCSYLKFGVKDRWNTATIGNFLKPTLPNPNVHQFVVWSRTGRDDPTGHMGIAYEKYLIHYQNWYNEQNRTWVTEEELSKVINRYKSRGGSDPVYYDTGDLYNWIEKTSSVRLI